MTSNLNSYVRAGAGSCREARWSGTVTLASWMQHAERGLAGNSAWYSDCGVRLTHGFRPTKVWMPLRSEGVAKLGRLVQQKDFDVLIATVQRSGKALLAR